MSLCDDIRRRRDAGKVHCAIRNQHYEAPEAAAAAFGLRAEESCYHEIPEQEAQAIATTILNRDLAYNTELMSLEDAGALASEFLRTCGPKARYFTNARFDGPSIIAWEPATAATFDTGVLILGDRTACFWIEDED